MYAAPALAFLTHAPMSLSFRPAQNADLPRCHALLAPIGPQVYEPDVWAALPALWARLIAERRLEIHVFEDSARPTAVKLFCMASGVFITPEFAATVAADPQPYLANQVYRRELTGDSVILAHAAVGRANAGRGVDVLGIDYGLERVNWTDLAGLRLLPLVPESLREFVGGYRINSLHRELFGREIHLLARTGGWRLRSAYRGKPTMSAGAAPSAGRAALFGLTRDEALQRPGTLASLHFLYQEPRFRFTPAQQALLSRALRGQSDTEAAGALGISPSTVKKHWEAVLERVTRIRPDWLPEESAAMEEGKRGVEKRRHLLNYLRQHLEELRPIA